MAKAIGFDYFKVYARQFNEERNVMEERICDLSNALTQVQEIPTRNRVYRLGNDQARLQSVGMNNNKWELHFIRIRKDGFPVKTNDDGTYGYFDDLDEAEGFGEEVSVLYDPENCVIMIRRNMHSLSPSAISNYFTDVVNQPGFTIFFKPLVHPQAIQLLTRDHLIRSADVSVADIKNSNETTRRALGRIVNRTDDINESVSISYKISIQQKGSKKNSRLPVYEELEQLAADPNVTKVEVRQKADEDARTETVDLIRHRLKDYSNFSETDISPESRNILHSTVISRMHQLYRSRIEEINNLYE
ncbi:hypothetical protein KO561_12940 [Radiobacillus kanasensis]|uniref:DUF6731 family protein n=1 Tax=Radiobacillus kanasensis TaxID=2844358 RepID=UPI001E466C0A|nr:DUF6731 family protein [Radiobacillus kanasensis]UFT98108.1 hypothetical protein KO561_12940 [Radiobacillus kanasensis]